MMEKQATNNSTPPVFFIIGIPRSGTTLLQQILDHHSQIGVCPESNFMENILRYDARESFRTAWHYQQFVEGVSNWLVKFNDPAYLLIQEQFKSKHQYAGSSKGLLGQLINRYLEIKGKKIFGEKTPENTYFLKELQAFCPTAKYIILLRHPLDIICSLSRSLAKAFNKPQAYTDSNLLKSAVFVKRGLQSIFSQQHTYKNNKHLIHYEKLVREPEQTLHALCTFLEVPFEPEMLRFSSNNFFISKDTRAADLHKGLSQPINTRSINQHEELLSPSQISLLTHFLSDEFKELSYTLPSSLKSLSLQQKIHLYRYRLLFRLKYYLWKASWIQLKIKLKSFLH